MKNINENIILFNFYQVLIFQLSVINSLFLNNIISSNNHIG